MVLKPPPLPASPPVDILRYGGIDADNTRKGHVSNPTTEGEREVINSEVEYLDLNEKMNTSLMSSKWKSVAGSSAM